MRIVNVDDVNIGRLLGEEWVRKSSKDDRDVYICTCCSFSLAFSLSCVREKSLIGGTTNQFFANGKECDLCNYLPWLKVS